MTNLDQLIAAERYPDNRGATYSNSSASVFAERKAGADTAIIEAFGRTNKTERQEIAAKFAKITESFEIEPIIPRRKWRVRYTTTHRIVPLSQVIGDES